MTYQPLRLGSTETGAGPTVMFLHGLDSDSSVWNPAIELLAQDHRCVAVDLPGHGRSPSPSGVDPYSRAAVLGDLDELMAGLDRPIHLVGHSLGGYLAMAHVITRPGVLAGLILVSTGPGFRDDQARAGWNERVRDNISKYQVSADAATIAFHVDSLVIDQIADVDVPVALVVGSDDRAFLSANDYMERKLPDVVRTTVEGARHYVMKSHPEAVADAVRAIVSRTA